MDQEIRFFLILIIIAILVVVAKTRSRYHGKGQAADYRNLNNYGTPVKSLYTSTKIFTLHHKIDITNEAGEVEYHAASKLLTLHDYTELFDRNERKVATITRRFFTIHQTHNVTMANGTTFSVVTELFHLIKDVIDIKELGWKIQGNILQLNFEIRGADNHLIATIGQKMISMHDMYSIDLYDTTQEEQVVALLITLQHIICDRKAAAAAAGAAAGSSSSSHSSSHH